MWLTSEIKYKWSVRLCNQTKWRRSPQGILWEAFPSVYTFFVSKLLDISQITMRGGILWPVPVEALLPSRPEGDKCYFSEGIDHLITFKTTTENNERVRTFTSHFWSYVVLSLGNSYVRKFGVSQENWAKWHKITKDTFLMISGSTVVIV